MDDKLNAAAATDKPAPAAQGALRRWGRQLGWLLLIWTGSVAALGIFAGLMRWFMHAMGMR